MDSGSGQSRRGSSNIHVHNRFVKFLLATDLGRLFPQRDGILAQILKRKSALLELFAFAAVERGIPLLQHLQVGRLFKDPGGSLQGTGKSIHSGNVSNEDIFQIGRVAPGFGIKIGPSAL